MSDLKISQLPAASALTGTEAIPAVQSGATVRSTPTALKAYLASSMGAIQTLFYLLNFQPASTQAGDVQLTNVLGTIPNRWVATNLLYLQKSATPMTGANQILRLYEGTGKTGQQISGGDFGTIAAGNSPGQNAVFEDNAIVTAINTGSNQPFYPSSTSQTLYASMSAAGVTGTGSYDIFVQGIILPFGP